MQKIRSIDRAEPGDYRFNLHCLMMCDGDFWKWSLSCVLCGCGCEAVVLLVMVEVMLVSCG